MRTPNDYIEALDLQPHPEGGWYRETYRAAETIPQEALPGRYGGARPFATAIYFLLSSDTFSALTASSPMNSGTSTPEAR